jgi:hypothetical protein
MLQGREFTLIVWFAFIGLGYSWMAGGLSAEHWPSDSFGLSSI